MLRFRPSSVEWLSRPRIFDDFSWTNLMDDPVVHRRLKLMEWCYYLMDVSPSSGLTLGSTCAVGSGRTLWTSWRWIIFRFSISCPFVQRVVQDIVVILAKLHFFVRHVSRNCWLTSIVDLVSQKNRHVFVSEWRTSFR